MLTYLKSQLIGSKYEKNTEIRSELALQTALAN